jgi:hypothetical protein
MPPKKLKEAVERVFSKDFLFHRDNRAWHNIVVDEDGNPIDVECFQLATFSDVAANASPVPAAMGKEIASALASSKVVEAKTDASGQVVLRRKERLQLAEDPDLRTVFAKPIHFDATDDQIRGFFSQWGKVEAVERRQYLAGTAGNEKVRPSTFIVFSTIDEAAKCVAAKPSYGKGTTELGSMWIPQLTVVMKQAHETAQSLLIQRGAALQVQHAMAGSSSTVRGRLPAAKASRRTST